MRTATVSAGMLCGVAAVVVALLGVAAVETKTLPNNLMSGAQPFAIYPGIGRYSLHAEARNWTDAHGVCSYENGHLAVIDSQDEADIILGIMDTNSKVDIHIGLHDMFAEGKFVSVLGQALEKLGYQTWSAGEPTGGVAESYCALKNMGTGNSATGLTDVPSSLALPFICELPMWDDYDLIPGQGYYKLHNELRTWKDSWDTCRLEGAYLLILTSDAERDAVVSKYVSVVSDRHIWYGAHHMFVNQQFFTIFDETLYESGFSTWMPEYPSIYDNTVYPYVVLHMVSGDPFELELGFYNDQYPFICKHDLHDAA